MKMFERNAEQITEYEDPWNRDMQKESHWIFH